MVNPYFCYALSFFIAITIYLLGWSKLYPPLSPVLFLFLIFTIFLSIVVGSKVIKRQTLKFSGITFSKAWVPIITTIFIYLLWIFDFLNEGGIPLIKILFDQPYNYRLFGIPTLHVFIVTFSSFFTILLFHAYLSTRKKYLLLLYFLNLAAALLIYSRAMFFFNLSSSFFMFLFWAKKPSTWFFYVLPLAIVLLFYFFGVVGTLRVSREAKSEFDSRLFLKTGDASDSFQNSVIPNEYFWTYIYMSSSLANLQENVNSYPGRPVSVKAFLEMINNEVLMDFISKRVNVYFGIDRVGEHKIIGPFNVSTVYSGSFSYLGWPGMWMMFCIVMIIPWGYRKIIPSDSPFFLSGFAILCTIFLFLAYDNMIRFTGLSFQLAYPVVFHFIVIKFPMAKKFFMI